MTEENYLDKQTEELVRLYFARGEQQHPVNKTKSNGYDSEGNQLNIDNMVPIYNPNKVGLWRIMSAPNGDGYGSEREQLGDLLQGRFIEAVERAVSLTDCSTQATFYQWRRTNFKEDIQSIKESGWIEEVPFSKTYDARLDDLADELSQK